MKLLMMSAAAIALAGAVHAQDAFVTQIGEMNAAGNFSFNNNTPNANTQVVAQQGTSMAAVNIANGSGNTAWAHQTNVEAPGDSFSTIIPFVGPISNATPSDFAQHESLIWQNGTDNTAINVALDENIIRSGDCGLLGCVAANAGAGAHQQTIQNGVGNQAVNWSQDSLNRRIDRLTPDSIGNARITAFDPEITNPAGASVATPGGFRFGSYEVSVDQNF